MKTTFDKFLNVSFMSLLTIVIMYFSFGIAIATSSIIPLLICIVGNALFIYAAIVTDADIISNI